MTTTTKKKARRINKAAATTRKPTKPTKPDTSLADSSADERWKVIAVAAYHKAEQRGFVPGEELQDWIEAEKEIDKILFG